MLSFNISPETLISFETIDKNSIPNDWIVAFEDDRIIWTFISDDKIDMHGVATYTKELGVIPSLLKELVAEKDRLTEINDRKGTDWTPAIPAKRQNVKLIVNSFYGCCGQAGG